MSSLTDIAGTVISSGTPWERVLGLVGGFVNIIVRSIL